MWRRWLISTIPRDEEFQWSFKGETSALKSKIHVFYQNLSKGDYEAAFDFVHDGSRGFTHEGMLKELPNEAVKGMVRSQMKEDREKGYVFKALPKHINITNINEGAALATYYVEGTIDQPNGKPESLLNRGSLVLTKVDGDWKIAHWHISKLESEGKD